MNPRGVEFEFKNKMYRNLSDSQTGYPPNRQIPLKGFETNFPKNYFP